MGDTQWGDVLVFLAFQVAAAIVWLRMRRSRPETVQPETALPEARVIPLAPYLPPVEPDAWRRVVAHR